MGLETRINTMLVFGFTINSSGGKYKPNYFFSTKKLHTAKLRDQFTQITRGIQSTMRI